MIAIIYFDCYDNKNKAPVYKKNNQTFLNKKNELLIKNLRFVELTVPYT
jgi:hypothetical protein